MPLQHCARTPGLAAADKRGLKPMPRQNPVVSLGTLFRYGAPFKATDKCDPSRACIDQMLGGLPAAFQVVGSDEGEQVQPVVDPPQQLYGRYSTARKGINCSGRKLPHPQRFPDRHQGK